ncbi:MAG: hypothetical protein KDI08_05975, partial [Pseudomonadales bacterium]|nr:hypothetical protein [Pseudomonadales bacterium]
PHVRVGHRQAPKKQKPRFNNGAFVFGVENRPLKQLRLHIETGVTMFRCGAILREDTADAQSGEPPSL